MKKFFAVFMILILITSFSACSKKENLNEISKNLSTYEINLNLDCDSKTVKASQTVKYLNNTNSILKTLKFHLYPQFFEQGATDKIVSSTKMSNTYPNGMSYADFNINRVKIEEAETSFVYECEFDSILSVELNSSLMPNEKINIYIEYQFSLPNCYHRFGYGESTINLCNFYPIACIYEENEFNTNGYNSNGDPFYSDIANYCVNITLDKQYIVAGTGTKTNENIENGKKKICFSATAVRDFALIASEKFNVINEKVNDTNVEYYYINDPHHESSLKAGVDAIKTFSKLFGNYPYDSFSIVECDFIHGGMEYPNLVMISTSIEDEIDYLNVIIHETAHQWWYGIVGNDEFSHPWLDEALTEFSTVLFYDYNKDYKLNHEQMLKSSKENYTLFISVYQDVLGQIDTSMRAVDKYSTEPEYTYCIYVKGVLMFESLYQLIGEKLFISCLKTYFNENKFTNATPEDLICAFEKTSKQNLSNFFDSWTAGKVIIR